MTDLDIFSGRCFQFCDLGLAAIWQNPSFEEWAFTWNKLKRVDRIMPWAIGDLLVYGEDAYGEMVSQELDANEPDEHSRFSPGVIGQYRYVSRQWPRLSRLNLPWSYHQATAHLPMEQRLALMQRCLDEGIKRAELRKLAYKQNGGKSPNPPTQTQDTVTELIQDNYEKDKKIIELETRLAQMQSTQSAIGFTLADNDLPPVIIQAKADLQQYLDVTGYSAVTIMATGEVRWIA